MTKITVTKANGAKQAFERLKIVRTCLRMGASENMSEAVADEVEKQVVSSILSQRFRH